LLSFFCVNRFGRLTMAEDPTDQVPGAGASPDASGQEQSEEPKASASPEASGEEPSPTAEAPNAEASPEASGEEQSPPAEEEVGLAMSPPDVTELSDEQQDRVNAANQAAAEAIEDGDNELALKKYTEAISVGCATAMLYAKRAQMLFKLGRPKDSIRDCTAAIAVNENSAKAYKIRARCNENLEKWLEADRDYQTSLKIDFDDDTEEMSREAGEKAKAMRDAAARRKRTRVEEEHTAYQKKLKEDGERYVQGLRTNEAKWKQEAEETKKQEEERRKMKKQPTKDDVEAEGGAVVD